MVAGSEDRITPYEKWSAPHYAWEDPELQDDATTSHDPWTRGNEEAQEEEDDQEDGAEDDDEEDDEYDDDDDAIQSADDASSPAK